MKALVILTYPCMTWCTVSIQETCGRKERLPYTFHKCRLITEPAMSACRSGPVFSPQAPHLINLGGSHSERKPGGSLCPNALPLCFKTLTISGETSLPSVLRRDWVEQAKKQKTKNPKQTNKKTQSPDNLESMNWSICNSKLSHSGSNRQPFFLGRRGCRAGGEIFGGGGRSPRELSEGSK